MEILACLKIFILCVVLFFAFCIVVASSEFIAGALGIAFYLVIMVAAIIAVVADRIRIAVSKILKRKTK